MEDPLALGGLISRITTLTQRKAEAVTRLKSLEESIQKLDDEVSTKRKQQNELQQLIAASKRESKEVSEENEKLAAELQQETTTSSKMQGTLDNMEANLQNLHRIVEEENISKSLQVKGIQEQFTAYENIATAFITREIQIEDSKL